ncbi:MAG: hypothetical protein V1800_00245 [Candidatus Latescibacterota bacterium]
MNPLLHRLTALSNTTASCARGDHVDTDGLGWDVMEKLLGEHCDQRMLGLPGRSEKIARTGETVTRQACRWRVVCALYRPAR